MALPQAGRSPCSVVLRPAAITQLLASAALLALGILLAAHPPAAWGGTRGLPEALGPGSPGAGPAGPGVGLECRLGNQPWQPCRMEVEQVGVQWTLVIGGQRLQFRHDGRGGVTLSSGGGTLRAVTGRWEPVGELCWDGVCARGDLPLD